MSKVIEMERFVEQTLLFDFYGELLTDHQKKLYEDIIIDDLSYSEIAKMEGISRQGVYDLIKRCDKILEEYEDKLKLIEKFMNTKKKVSEINCLANELKDETDNEALLVKIEEIERISNAICEEY